MTEQKNGLVERLGQRGISRRDFMKFCGVMAGTLALPHAFVPTIAKAMERAADEVAKRPAVVWLELSDCAGCTESFLRAPSPTAAEVVLDVISLDYHETIMAASGHQAEEAKAQTIKAGGHLVLVEGAIPLKDDGIYCTIGGRTSLDILKEATDTATAVLCVGSCSSFGGIPKANPNPTDAVGVMELQKRGLIRADVPIVNLSGCPVNVVNVTATIVHFLTFGTLPNLDGVLRPLFAYGALIHDNCERRGHFNAGEFVKQWGDDGHRNGWCLYEMGCKGPIAYKNCPTVRYNGGTNWPVGAGHGCVACALPDFWDVAPIYEPVKIKEAHPPEFYPSVDGVADQPVDQTSAMVTGAVGGLIVGAAGAMAISRTFTSENEA
jgi:hydrogenase small subunit